VLKGGFVVGVRHGRGVALVRDEQGAWRPPVFVSLTGGSIGWQAGLQATDVILVFRTSKSVQGLLNGKFTIGADAAAAAGPVGRQASAATDAQLRAEILSYSRSRGLFAGVSLDGSMLQIDQATTQAYYQLGSLIPNAAGWPNPATLPSSAVQLLDAVARHTGSDTRRAECRFSSVGSAATRERTGVAGIIRGRAACAAGRGLPAFARLTRRAVERLSRAAARASTTGRCRRTWTH
jgi:SH3 domain-containing YSC84-like protein 1